MNGGTKQEVELWKEMQEKMLENMLKDSQEEKQCDRINNQDLRGNSILRSKEKY